MDKEDKVILIACLIGTLYNLGNISLFVILAIHFKKWYLALISLLFLKNYSITTKSGENKNE